jgi:RNA polymerase sporulation-specific sigma factor
MLLLLLKYACFFSYIEGNSFPEPLSPSEENECIAKMSAGSEDAKNKLIEHNLRLVAHIVKKYSNYQKESEDLISIGTIGLIKAVKTYKKDKNIKLGTYASKCIENEILMFLRNRKKSRNDISLQDTVGIDKDGNEVALQDKIADDEMSIEDKVGLKLQIKILYDKLQKILTKREKKIIELRYGLSTGEEITQREIASMLGISRSYVSRIEKKALEKLCTEMK